MRANAEGPTRGQCAPPPRTLISAATRISEPPASTLARNVAPPHQTAVSAANSTSDDITMAVVVAFRRAAPYCRHRLDAMKARARPAEGSSHADPATGQATPAAPPADSAAAVAPA